MNREVITSEMLELARKFRKQPTPAERLAWELLRDRRFLKLKFKRQKILLGFYVDFYCHELKLVVEIDGNIHQEPLQAKHDAVRTAHLEGADYLVLRVKNELVSTNLVEAIRPLLVRSPRALSPR
jgi:very-short-patch-repair endonuclease